MKSASFLLLLLAALPATSHAQTAADSLRKRGELTGSRPSGDLLAKPRTQTPARRAAASAPADPVQQHLLGTEVNLAQAVPSQLPDLYESFIATTRADRRQWSYADWDAASQVLARLNQRYEQVRTDLPLEERLRIRSFQGEFRTLRGAREVKNKFD